MTSILDRIGNTPLVRLQRICRDLPVPVLVKCEHMNPGGSIKDRIALATMEDVEEHGLLRPGMTLIEATAGNTAVGLALVAASRGYRLVGKGGGDAQRTAGESRELSECRSAYGFGERLVFNRSIRKPCQYSRTRKNNALIHSFNHSKSSTPQ